MQTKHGKLSGRRGRCQNNNEVLLSKVLNAQMLKYGCPMSWRLMCTLPSSICSWDKLQPSLCNPGRDIIMATQIWPQKIQKWNHSGSMLSMSPAVRCDGNNPARPKLLNCPFAIIVKWILKFYYEFLNLSAPSPLLWCSKLYYHSLLAAPCITLSSDMQQYFLFFIIRV